MNYYEQLDPGALRAELDRLESAYQCAVASLTSLDMSRGKPSEAQLDLSRPLLDALNSSSDLVSENENAANYGVPRGLRVARELFGKLLEVDPARVIVSGSSSLNLMFDVLSLGYMTGLSNCDAWRISGAKQELKWLCPAPGYDRHFAVSKYFGFTNVAVPMREDGPDMDVVEKLVQDERVKGIWCVPRFSNPTGVVYSDAVVKRFARLTPAASDFRIMWDNAYCVHTLTPEAPELLNIFSVLNDSKDLVFEFASTSKITFAGAGIAAMAGSTRDIEAFMQTAQIARVCSDKISQLAHVKFLPNKQAVLNHMTKMREVLRPKFDLVENVLSRELGELHLARWTRPQGGYFVSFDGQPNSATEIVRLCKEAGLVLTGAGATWPENHDPCDTNIRIAPSFPTLDELERALNLFVLCVKLQAARAALH